MFLLLLNILTFLFLFNVVINLCFVPPCVFLFLYKTAVFKKYCFATSHRSYRWNRNLLWDTNFRLHSLFKANSYRVQKYFFPKKNGIFAFFYEMQRILASQPLGVGVQGGQLFCKVSIPFPAETPCCLLRPHYQGIERTFFIRTHVSKHCALPVFAFQQERRNTRKVCP